MFLCPFCNRENEDWHSFCQYCGTRLEDPVFSTGKRKPEGKETTPLSAPEILPPNRKADPSSSKLRIRESLRQPVFEETTPLMPVIPMEDSSLPPEPPVPPKRITREPTAPRTPLIKVPDVSCKICAMCAAEISGTNLFCGQCGHPSFPASPEHSGGSSAVATPAPLKEASPKKDLKPPMVFIVHFREEETVDFGFSLRVGETLIGRDNGDILFPGDALLSKRHLRFFYQPPQVLLEDLSSTNGTYLRIKRSTPLQDGDFILLGNQVLRFDLPQSESAGGQTGRDKGDQTMGMGSNDGIAQPRLVKRLSRGQDGNEYPLTEESTLIGRDSGDILFRGDCSVSTPHARVVRRNSFFLLEDMSSARGTYLRLRTPVQVDTEDFFIIGEQLFQIRVKLV